MFAMFSHPYVLDIVGKSRPSRILSFSMMAFATTQADITIGYWAIYFQNLKIHNLKKL